MIAMDYARAEYHNTPDPEFETLCQDADRAGAWVELDVSANSFGAPGHEYRNIVALHVRHPKLTRPRVTVRVQTGDTLRSMAERARVALEAQL